MEQEVWKEIPGYEGYLININGDILKNKSYRKNRHGTISSHKGGLCKITIYNKYRGYVSITINGKRKMMVVSRLMGYVFLGLDINNKKILVCHKDDNPSNNKLENLFLGTHKDNSQDMAIKCRGGSRKLDYKDVLKIRELYNKGQCISSISRDYKMSYYAIYAICKRLSWKFI